MKTVHPNKTYADDEAITVGDLRTNLTKIINAFSKKDVNTTVTLYLPDSYGVSRIMTVGIWCDPANEKFGSTVITEKVPSADTNYLTYSVLTDILDRLYAYNPKGKVFVSQGNPLDNGGLWVRDCYGAVYIDDENQDQYIYLE